MPLVGPKGIDLSLKQTQAWKYLEDKTTTKVFFGGGAGASKSTLGCLWQIFRRTKYKGTRGFVGRDTYKELRDSTMATFFSVLHDMNYVGGRDYTYNAQDENITWNNGSETHFRYMQFKPSDPDFHRFGSTEYTDAFVDEAPGVDRRAVQVLESRLRYKHVEYGLIPKTLLTGNPGDHWVKEEFVYDKHGVPVNLPNHIKVVLATIRDHPDAEFAQRYIKTLENLDPYDRARLLDGDWLVGPRTGKEFFWAFDTTKNVRPGIYDPTKYLHIGFDFNRSPYMTLVVFQIAKVGLKYEMQGLKEYCLEHPLNNTESVCKAFKYDIDEGDFKGHKAGVRFYGDYSGKTGRTTERDGIAHDYDVVWSVLARYLDARSDWVVPNPLHKRVSMWMNAVFAGKTDVLIYLDPKMSNTIKDFSQVKEDADGSMLKEKAIDRTTGKSYEKLGHTSQAAYYISCSAFADSFDAYTG